MKMRSLIYYVVAFTTSSMGCDEDGCDEDGTNWTREHTLVLRGPVGREVAICREVGVGKRQITRHTTLPTVKSSGHHSSEVRHGIDRLSTRGFREMR